MFDRHIGQMRAIYRWRRPGIVCVPVGDLSPAQLAVG
jgi:hypothetical protein